MIYPVKLKRLGVLKTACFLGLSGLFMGIIIDLILVILSLILGSILSSIIGSSEGISSIIGTNVTSMILLPLILGVVNFLSGLIFTPLANLSLKIIRGIDLEMEGED